jgi:hypothetical protein
MGAQVSTYSGHRLHERPLSFYWQERRLEVREILEQGYGPDSLFFKVVAADGGVYLLQYGRVTDSWEVRVCAPRLKCPAYPKEKFSLHLLKFCGTIGHLGQSTIRARNSLTKKIHLPNEDPL